MLVTAAQSKTLPGSAALPSAHLPPVVIVAAIFMAIVVFPVPIAPARISNFPRANQPRHCHGTSRGTTAVPLTISTNGLTVGGVRIGLCTLDGVVLPCLHKNYRIFPSNFPCASSRNNPIHPYPTPFSGSVKVPSRPGYVVGINAQFVA